MNDSQLKAMVAANTVVLQQILKSLARIQNNRDVWLGVKEDLKRLQSENPNREILEYYQQQLDSLFQTVLLDK